MEQDNKKKITSQEMLQRLDSYYDEEDKIIVVTIGSSIS